jgi:hypothetical protein
LQGERVVIGNRVLVVVAAVVEAVVAVVVRAVVRPVVVRAVVGTLRGSKHPQTRQPLALSDSTATVPGLQLQGLYVGQGGMVVVLRVVVVEVVESVGWLENGLVLALVEGSTVGSSKSKHAHTRQPCALMLSAGVDPGLHLQGS